MIWGDSMIFPWISHGISQGVSASPSASSPGASPGASSAAKSVVLTLQEAEEQDVPGDAAVVFLGKKWGIYGDLYGLDVGDIWLVVTGTMGFYEFPIILGIIYNPN